MAGHAVESPAKSTNTNWYIPGSHWSCCSQTNHSQTPDTSPAPSSHIYFIIHHKPEIKGECWKCKVTELLSKWDSDQQKESGVSRWRNVSVESDHQDSSSEAGGQERRLCLGQRWIYMDWRHDLILVLTLATIIAIWLTSATVRVIKLWRKGRHYEGWQHGASSANFLTLNIGH